MKLADEPIKTFAQDLQERMNEALKKDVDEIADEFIAKAEVEIKKRAKELAMKAGAWIMQQTVILPWRDGYEVRIFVCSEQEKK